MHDSTKHGEGSLRRVPFIGHMGKTSLCVFEGTRRKKGGDGTPMETAWVNDTGQGRRVLKHTHGDHFQQKTKKIGA
jgi:hypothetical protein